MSISSSPSLSSTGARELRLRFLLPSFSFSLEEDSMWIEDSDVTSPGLKGCSLHCVHFSGGTTALGFKWMLMLGMSGASFWLSDSETDGDT
jgi:hypothetical protein